MSEIVYMGWRDLAQLADLIEAVRPNAPHAIFESAAAVTFPAPSASVDAVGWPRGYVFGPHVELMWRLEGSSYAVRLTQAADAALPEGLGDGIPLDGYTMEQRAYYLWPAGETAVGGRLSYTEALPGVKQGQAVMREYYDAAGRLMFYRYVSLQEAPGD